MWKVPSNSVAAPRTNTVSATRISPTFTMGSASPVLASRTVPLTLTFCAIAETVMTVNAITNNINLFISVWFCFH